jgi:anti-sigma-K factor RskA
MMRPDAHTLVGAYVLDALDPSESAEVVEHLAACESCAAEVAELRSVTSSLADDVATAPPASLRTAVLDEVARTRQLGPQPTTRSRRRPERQSGVAGPGRRPSDRRWYQGRGPFAAVAAALAVVCLSLGFVVTDQRGELDANRTQIESLSALVTAAVDSPSATTVAGGGRIAVVRAGERALLVTRDLPALPEDRTYQLWVMNSTSSVRSAGLLSSSGNRGDDRFLDVAGLGQDDTDLAVTVEPAGGSKQPTTPVLASVKLNAARRN